MFCNIPPELRPVLECTAKKLMPWYVGNKNRFLPGMVGSGQISNTVSTARQLLWTARINARTGAAIAKSPFVSRKDTFNETAKIKQDVRHYETIKSWHRGCVETQAKVHAYLKECVAKHDLEEKYIVEPIGVGENKGGAHEHHAVMIRKPGQRYWDAIVVDPWATQNPTVNDMTFPFSLWVLAQAEMVNNGGFRVEKINGISK